MAKEIEVDVWIRGTNHATTHGIPSVPVDPRVWTETNVRELLSAMLLAVQREKHPEAEPPAVTLRGFNWVVSPFEKGGVLLHLELQAGTASAGPFAIDEARLTEMIDRVMTTPPAGLSIH
jgi:hypothetical protein